MVDTLSLPALLAGHAAADVALLEAVTHGDAQAGVALLARTDVTPPNQLELLARLDDLSRLRWVCAHSSPDDDLAVLLGPNLHGGEHKVYMYLRAAADGDDTIPRHVLAELLSTVSEEWCHRLMEISLDKATTTVRAAVVDRLVALGAAGELTELPRYSEAIAVLAADHAPLAVIRMALDTVAVDPTPAIRAAFDHVEVSELVCRRLVEVLVAGGAEDLVVRHGQLHAALASRSSLIPTLRYRCARQLRDAAPGLSHVAHLLDIASSLWTPSILWFADGLDGPLTHVSVDDLVAVAEGDDLAALSSIVDVLVARALSSVTTAFSDMAEYDVHEYLVELLAANPAVPDSYLIRLVELVWGRRVEPVVLAGRPAGAELLAALAVSSHNPELLLERATDPRRVVDLALDSSPAPIVVLAAARAGLLHVEDTPRLRPRALTALAGEIGLVDEPLSWVVERLGGSPRRWQLFCELGSGSSATIGELIALVDAAAPQ